MGEKWFKRKDSKSVNEQFLRMSWFSLDNVFFVKFNNENALQSYLAKSPPHKRSETKVEAHNLQRLVTIVAGCDNIVLYRPKMEYASKMEYAMFLYIQYQFKGIVQRTNFLS